MSEHEHHHDPIEDNIETHPLKLAIGIVIGAAALIVGIVLLAQFAVGAHGSRSMQDDPAMSAEQVARRLAPAARLVVDPAAPASAAAATPAPTLASVTIPPAAGNAPSPTAGKATFDAVCSVCHGAGVAGAPKLADKAAWAPRIKTGIEALHASALKGKGAMPPKGGNPALADADVKATVDYMVAAAK
ncbi:MAG TPA: c-type cytochrome [Usitatibacter sp.]